MPNTITTKKEAVTVKKPIVASAEYDCQTANSFGDALVLCGAKDDEVEQVADGLAELIAPFKDAVHEALRYFNYAFDLGVRSKLRQSLIAQSEDPDKVFNRLVADIMKAKPGISREKAEAKAKVLMESDED